MRYLTAFLFTMAILASASFGQTSSAQTPAQQSQPPAATQPQPPATAESPAPQQNPLAALQAAKERARRRVESQLRELQAHPLPNGPLNLNLEFDQGIYLRPSGLSKTCASIVSYNFTQGDNPQLQSVTTCTPAEGVRTKRAEDRNQNRKPQPPQVLKTSYSPGQ
jgi:hypothetical protein